MNFIVFDLEATCWKGRPRSKVQETIEIGALRIDRYGEVTGTFNKFIKPVLNPMLSSFCMELTSIDQVAINRAEKFPSVIEQFQDWTGIFEEDCIFCSWGNFDRKQLVADCELHDLSHDWLEQHINLKQQYQQIRQLGRPRGLHSAVEKEGFEFEGTHHRGYDDAYNLAKIFGKFIDEWVY